MTSAAALHSARWWRAAAWALLVVVAVYALVPLPDMHDGPTNLDKYLHTATFFVLTVWYCGVYERRRWARIMVGLLAFGAAIEVAQSQTGYRSPEIADMLANTLGIAVGLAASLVGAARWCVFVESRLLGSQRA